MKCDVCLTNIPIGESRCPNCGFLMKTNHITTFDVSGDDHAHIEVTTKDKLKNIKQYIPNNKPLFTQIQRNQKKYTKPNVNKVIIKIVIIFIIIFITMAVSIFSMLLDDLSFSTNTFNDMTFTEVLEDDYDDGTVKAALNYQNDFVDYLDSHGYEEIQISEYCSQYEDSPLYASMGIDAMKDNIHYFMDITFSEEVMQSYTLTLSGRLPQNSDRTQFLIKSSQITEISDYLGIPEAYKVLNDSHKKMELNENDEYKYSNYDDIKVYMVEEYQNSYDAYYFYYSIGSR